ncbi:hypothetical protein DL239_02515 [Sedimentitalea sp. CY04]|uniref:Uncharacterized protein n=1 Tax=Parasedimentitalea denitrificans TaxID=2211118 RepID=A0ABX0W2H9_9RHOB|nr:hypothetical protein [Sedimentitalea sp. CY04]
MKSLKLLATVPAVVFLLLEFWWTSALWAFAVYFMISWLPDVVRGLQQTESPKKEAAWAFFSANS